MVLLIYLPFFSFWFYWKKNIAGSPITVGIDSRPFENLPKKISAQIVNSGHAWEDFHFYHFCGTVIFMTTY